MPKPDSYNGIRKITTEGLTLPNGKFIGFYNGVHTNAGTTGQEVHIWGDLMYNGLTRSTGGITLTVAPNAYVPVDCTALKPASYPIIGYF